MRIRFSTFHYRPSIITRATLGLLVVGVATGVTIPASAQERIANRTTAASDSEHALVPAMRYARSSYDALDRVQDYQVRFMKQELVDGKVGQQVIDLKLRETPFSVYLKFHTPHEGREVIYVEGRNDGELLARDAGVRSIVGTISLDPNGRMAMAGNRYSVTMIGMRKMLDAVLDQWEQDRRHGDVAVVYYPAAKVEDRSCKVIESTVPTRRAGAKFHRTRLYIDAETGLPIRVQQYDFPERAGAEPKLVEEYSYLDLRTNVGMTDRDFDVKNPEYGF